ncbi:probable E3 ubiquitin-protein ligase ARI7 isoform X2 [Ananas comosus]|uniref:Probable E3 ubiquitin-protein ligase ARI7 isoform X2 n=1 Tax=Ananas comosus TaxID=4615 RepID=A0A6P5EM09_ANACO|nr:probable E3 ubiquitin-protein ligase ARI7 isoform X2 [Ananas comosus]
MDSEDDMHDANDLESPDDDFYSGDTAMGSDDGDGDYDFVDNELDDSEDIASHRQQHNYTILSEADTRQRQEEDISRVSTVLSISRSTACVLLRHYNWSVSKVHDEWFADEEKARKAVGLLEQPADMPNGREVGTLQSILQQSDPHRRESHQFLFVQHQPSVAHYGDLATTTTTTNTTTTWRRMRASISALWWQRWERRRS